MWRNLFLVLLVSEWPTATHAFPIFSNGQWHPRSSRESELPRYAWFPAENERDVGDDDRLSTSRRGFFREATMAAAAAVTLGLATSQTGSSVALAAGVTSSVSTDPDPVVFDLLPQFSTVSDVPDSYFQDNRFIYAFVERIIDGDTIRVRHVPGYGIGRKVPQPLQQRGISKDTLSIRIYGVDTPETGKNKRKTSQPFGDEAEAFTRNLVFNKMVKVTFLRKDQYGRAIAQVVTVEDSVMSRPKDLTMELAKAGLAELYTGGGAQYFGRQAEIEQAIEQAKSAKKGIWYLENRVSAAEYKRAEREGGGTPVASSSLNINNNQGKSSQVLLASVYGDTITTPAKTASKGMSTTPAKTKMGMSTLASNLLDVAITGLEIVNPSLDDDNKYRT